MRDFIYTCSNDHTFTHRAIVGEVPDVQKCPICKQDGKADKRPVLYIGPEGQSFTR